MTTERTTRSDSAKSRLQTTKEKGGFSVEYKDFLTDLGYIFLKVPPHNGLDDLVRILKESPLIDGEDGWTIQRNDQGGERVRGVVSQQPSRGRTIAFRPSDLIEGRISEVDLKRRLEKKGTIVSTQLGDSKAVGFELPTQAEGLFIIDTIQPDLRHVLLSSLSFTLPTADVFSITLSDMGISEEVVHPNKRDQYVVPFRTVLTDINVPRRSLRVGVVDARPEAVRQTGVLPILVSRQKA